MFYLLVMNGVNMGHILEIRIIYTFKIVIIMRSMGRFPSLIVKATSLRTENFPEDNTQM